jgi:hypothetical protein
MDRACSTQGEKNAHRVLVGKRERKRPLEISRSIYKDNKNNMDVREIGWRGGEWFHLAKDGDQ